MITDDLAQEHRRSAWGSWRQEPIVHVRPLGNPASSGSGQLLVTVTEYYAAMRAATFVHPWWVVVPTVIDPRGWRFVSLKWYVEQRRR